jgi:hypothetical protein
MQESADISPTIVSAALRTKRFPPTTFVVPGVIPAGATILAGRPKIGKSWVALDLRIVKEKEKSDWDLMLVWTEGGK